MGVRLRVRSSVELYAEAPVTPLSFLEVSFCVGTVDGSPVDFHRLLVVITRGVGLWTLHESSDGKDVRFMWTKEFPLGHRRSMYFQFSCVQRRRSDRHRGGFDLPGLNFSTSQKTGAGVISWFLVPVPEAAKPSLLPSRVVSTRRR